VRGGGTYEKVKEPPTLSFEGSRGNEWSIKKSGGTKRSPNKPPHSLRTRLSNKKKKAHEKGGLDACQRTGKRVFTELPWGPRGPRKGKTEVVVGDQDKKFASKETLVGGQAQMDGR